MKMTIDEVVSRAPSVGATEPHYAVSEKYTFLPTTETLKLLEDRGWFPMRVQEAPLRPKSSRQGFQKHIVNLRQEQDINAGTREDVFELLLENSHDRSTRQSLRGGVFRLVCTNGLVIAKAIFAELRVTHIHVDREEILRYVDNAGEFARNIQGHLAEMKSIELTDSQRLNFAESAMVLRYGENRLVWPVVSEKLLQPQRNADEGKTLWKTFNVIQENVIKGGQFDSRLDPNGRPYMPTKPITNLQRQMELNTGMWEIAESYVDLARN